jgi:stage II sporulation protein D
MQRTTTIFLAALALCAAAAQPVSAATRFVINGAGFGHGIGMSQYGADGYAQHGKDYAFILGHYYTGTRLSPLGSNPTVRVLLQTASRARFSGAAKAGGKTLTPGTTYTAVANGLGQVTLRTTAGRTLETVSSPLRVTGPSLRLAGTAQNGVANGLYRGALELRASTVGTVEAINAVDLEDYVRGVVGAESVPSWPAEALKAQAVAARTYAITTRIGGDFDQYADTRSQMYKGVAGEFASTVAAVADTRGQVVTYDGSPVTTFFFSTSGGHTENIENSFLGSTPRPWLKGVPDPYDSVSPVHRWGPITMSMAAAAKRLHGYVKGRFKGVVVTKRGVSPRVVSAQVVGSGGRTAISGPTLRDRFGLRDTWMRFTVVDGKGKTVKPPSGTSGSATGSGGTTDPNQSGGAAPGGGA